MRLNSCADAKYCRLLTCNSEICIVIAERYGIDGLLDGNEAEKVEFPRHGSTGFSVYDGNGRRKAYIGGVPRE